MRCIPHERTHSRFPHLLHRFHILSFLQRAKPPKKIIPPSFTSTAPYIRCNSSNMNYSHCVFHSRKAPATFLPPDSFIPAQSNDHIILSYFVHSYRQFRNCPEHRSHPFQIHNRRLRLIDQQSTLQFPEPSHPPDSKINRGPMPSTHFSFHNIEKR